MIRLLLLSLLLSGCATMGVRESSVLNKTTGEEWIVRLQHDGNLDFQKGEVKIKVDNRGRASLLEQALQAPLVGIMGTTSNLLNNSIEKASVK